MNFSPIKYRILFFVFDSISTIISYYILSLFIRKDIIVFSLDFIFKLVLIMSILSLFMEDYKKIQIRGYLKELKHSILYSFKLIIVFLLLYIFYKEKYILNFQKFNIMILFILFFISIPIIYFIRVILKKIINKINKYKIPVLVATKLNNEQEYSKVLTYSHEIKAYINLNYEEKTFNGIPVLTNYFEIRDFISQNNIEEIFFLSLPQEQLRPMLEILKILSLKVNFELSNVTDFFFGELSITDIHNKLFIISEIKNISIINSFIKRVIDILGAITGIIIMLIIAIIIYPFVQRDSKGPLFFKQKRVGQNGKIFNMYKFRSMYLDAEERKKELEKFNKLDTNLMFKIEEDPRIFPFGKKMRKWSLDEFPQFMNVLKGEMSLVGTRPPTLDEYINYDLSHFKRLRMKPGITGLWQISGRSNIQSFEDVMELDLKYIYNYSISLDLKILFKTLCVVFKKEGSM